MYVLAQVGDCRRRTSVLRPRAELRLSISGGQWRATRARVSGQWLWTTTGTWDPLKQKRKRQLLPSTRLNFDMYSLARVHCAARCSMTLIISSVLDDTPRRLKFCRRTMNRPFSLCHVISTSFRRLVHVMYENTTCKTNGQQASARKMGMCLT